MSEIVHQNWKVTQIVSLELSLIELDNDIMTTPKRTYKDLE